ncbi:hypothetical protein FS320_36750 [Microvirga tunisiensis]|uniref:Uncharacterized protein n=1 Tax=Microvirga tunisiensis TaxID=2108360 RepID=A0A5N7MTW6_9HYPH|nr:hypothetical protein [Microvirga tunisiensis]
MRTSLVILPSEVITLARALWGFAHGESKSRYLGFLMTEMLRLHAQRASGVMLSDAWCLIRKIPPTMRPLTAILAIEL